MIGYCVQVIRAGDDLSQVAGEITDFVSFYTLPSTVMHHPVHKTLKAAYAFYNVSTRTPWVELMQDALVVAKNVSSASEFFLQLSGVYMMFLSVFRHYWYSDKKGIWLIKNCHPERFFLQHPTLLQ